MGPSTGNSPVNKYLRKNNNKKVLEVLGNEGIQTFKLGITKNNSIKSRAKFWGDIFIRKLWEKLSPELPEDIFDQRTSQKDITANLFYLHY